jgi:hypothetical protein
MKQEPTIRDLINQLILEERKEKYKKLIERYRHVKVLEEDYPEMLVANSTKELIQNIFKGQSV